MSKRFAALAMLALLLGACSPKEPVHNDPWMDTEPEPATPASYEVEADTLTYDFLAEEAVADDPAAEAEADLPVADEPVAEPAVVEEAPPVIAPEPVAPPQPSGPLYYVQIFASKSRQSAEELALKADNRLDETVRILYLEPYYKVLVGGFADRDAAVVLRRDLTDMGYQGAWIFEH